MHDAPAGADGRVGKRHARGLFSGPPRFVSENKIVVKLNAINNCLFMDKLITIFWFNVEINGNNLF